MIRLVAVGLCAAVCLAAVASGQDTGGARVASLTFEGDKALEGVATSGNVAVEAGKGRQEGGSALRVGPGGKAVWRFADQGASGTVEMWVFEDGKQRGDEKAYGAGPLWGVLDADGAPVLLVGAVYAPYLAGNTTYATSDLIPGSDERPWQQVQYLGIRRDKGWRKWTFRLDAEQGMTLLCDDKPINGFNKEKIRLNAVRGIMIVGDDDAAGQTVWIDDVTARPGAPMRSEPLWPPPPPAELAIVAPPAEHDVTPYAKWKNGPSSDPNYFPIAVWLQSPSRAAEYKAAGINLYVGLWQGPTEEQLAELRKHGMPVICDQNEVGLKYINDPIIVGWMHGDEPDNAHKFDEYWKRDKEKIREAWPELYASQQLDKNDYRGYGPPVPPKWIVRDYETVRRRDPSRPVFLNLGCGVAWDEYIGRGERTGKLEDYPEYIKGCDIVSYDVYPVTTGQLASQLWYQARGVGRLRTWTQDRKPVWNCLECTGMSDVNVKPTPHQVKAQAWMSLIHGSRGLVYFVHQFNPFDEAALLSDPEMLAEVTALNRRIHELAPVLNSPTVADAVTVTSSEPHTPVHAIVKRHGGATYVFAVSMYSRKTEATFKVTGLPAGAKAEVIGEDRSIDVADGVFKDAFAGHEVHLYRIK